MKNLFLLLAITVSSIAFGQSNRVLSQSEKLSLSTNQVFSEKCKQAVRDFSVYWSAHDGSGLSTEAERITWAKNRYLSVQFIKNPIINEDATTLNWFFLNAAKGKQFLLNASPVDAVTLIALWDSGNSFEEFVAIYFSVKGDEVNFSVSGN